MVLNDHCQELVGSDHAFPKATEFHGDWGDQTENCGGDRGDRHAKAFATRLSTL